MRTDDDALTLPTRLKDVSMLLARGEPVLVLGPGCQRIAYDDPSSVAWREVTRRVQLMYSGCDDHERLFLAQLWQSKLTPQPAAPSHRPIASQTPRDALESAGTIPERPLDPLMVDGLALPLLRALIECTRALGASIASGKIPVVSWSTVRSPRTDSSPHDAAADHLKLAAKAAAALHHWREHPSAGGLDSYGLGPASRHPKSSQALRDWAAVLKPRAIDSNARTFAARCLGAGGGPFTLSGANVEWLADLWWHVVTCDSGVPPSQKELAFYVNLRYTEKPRPRTLTRAYPNELRLSRDPKERLLPAELQADIRHRLLRGPNGLERRVPNRRADLPRVQVVRTLAATLIAMWGERTDADDDDLDLAAVWEPPTDDDSSDSTEASGLVPIAMVASYDLLLERELMGLVAEGGQFHVLVPVWITSAGLGDHKKRPEDFRMSWLWGTYTKRAISFKPDVLTSHKSEWLSWEWYRQLGKRFANESDVRVPTGPVLIRVNGSPLLQFVADSGDPARTRDLGLPPDDAGLGRDYIYPATIISEFDALTAVMELSGEAPGRTASGLAREVASSLSWDLRSWLFLGDSFPDWLPRLRLLLNARTRLPGDSHARRRSRADPPEVADLESIGAAMRNKAAIDLEFDWPEEALLSSLEVDAYWGDLVELLDYPEVQLDDPIATAFLDQVRTLAQTLTQ